MPIYALVDYDPDGLNIFRCYKWGSAALEHEEETKLPSLRWLGIKSQDLHGIAAQDQVASSFSGFPPTQAGPLQQERMRPSGGPFKRLLQLTQRDRKLATKLLNDFSNGYSHDGDSSEALLEVQKMLMMNVKAEIQAMNEEGDIATYLEKELVKGLH